MSMEGLDGTSVPNAVLCGEVGGLGLMCAVCVGRGANEGAICRLPDFVKGRGPPGTEPRPVVFNAEAYRRISHLHPVKTRSMSGPLGTRLHSADLAPEGGDDLIERSEPSSTG